MFPLALCLAVMALGFAPAALAGNWPHWRGPVGNGTAIDASPPTTWSATENVRWKVKLPGREQSSPIIWNDRVFVTTAAPSAVSAGPRLPTFEFKLLCINRRDGTIVWQQTATTAKPHQGTHATNGFASASPCTDGERVYAHFGSRGLYCYSLDGRPLWKRDDFGTMDTLNDFGEGSSPTLAGNKILVPWDHQGPSALWCLDKQTGQTLWKTDRDEPTCWSTPLVVAHGSGSQVVLNGQKFARSYDLESGKELWRCGGQTRRPVASAVAGNGLVFVTSGFQGAFLGAFRPDGQGDIENTKHVAWTLTRDTPDIASPLLVGNRLYFHKGKSGLLSCVDAQTGNPHFQAVRVPGVDSVYSSPVAAGGHIYLTARNGTTVVIEDADEFKVMATNTIDETVGATPAPVDRELFLRGDKHLYCIAAP